MFFAESSSDFFFAIAFALLPLLILIAKRIHSDRSELLASRCSRKMLDFSLLRPKAEALRFAITVQPSRRSTDRDRGKLSGSELQDYWTLVQHQDSGCSSGGMSPISRG